MVGHDFIYLATVLGLKDCEERRSKYAAESEYGLHVEIDHSQSENGFAKLDETEA
jgi:hypothetical protein